MKNYDARIKKLQESLSLKGNMVLMIDYLTSKPQSYFEVNGIEYPIPIGVDVKEFINKKLKNFRGIVTASIYVAKDMTKESVPDLSDLATGKDDLAIIIKSYTGRK